MKKIWQNQHIQFQDLCHEPLLTPKKLIPCAVSARRRFRGHAAWVTAAYQKRRFVVRVKL